MARSNNPSSVCCKAIENLITDHDGTIVYAEHQAPIMYIKDTIVRLGSMWPIYIEGAQFLNLPNCLFSWSKVETCFLYFPLYFDFCFCFENKICVLSCFSSDYAWNICGGWTQWSRQQSLFDNYFSPIKARCINKQGHSKFHVNDYQKKMCVVRGVIGCISICIFRLTIYMKYNLLTMHLFIVSLCFQINICVDHLQPFIMVRHFWLLHGTLIQWYNNSA